MDVETYLKDLLIAFQAGDGAEVKSFRLEKDTLRIHLDIGHREFMVVVTPTDLDVGNEERDE